MPIESATPEYQLSDLKLAGRLVVLRRATFTFVDFKIRSFCFFEVTRPARTKHLPVSSTIGTLLTDTVLEMEQYFIEPLRVNFLDFIRIAGTARGSDRTLPMR